MKTLDVTIQEMIENGFIYKAEELNKYSEDSNYSHTAMSDNGELINDFLLKKGFVHSQRTEKVLNDLFTFEVFKKGAKEIQYRNQEELRKEGYLKEGDFSTHYRFSGF